MTGTDQRVDEYVFQSRLLQQSVSLKYKIIFLKYTYVHLRIISIAMRRDSMSMNDAPKGRHIKTGKLVPKLIPEAHQEQLLKVIGNLQQGSLSAVKVLSYFQKTGMKPQKCCYFLAQREVGHNFLSLFFFHMNGNLVYSPEGERSSPDPLKN